MSHENDFRLIVSPTNPNWVDVVFPEGPKFMIDIAAWTCTCKKEQGKDCLHKKRLKIKTHLTR